MSCECGTPKNVDPLIGRSPLNSSREVGSTGPTGPTGTVENMAGPAGPWAAIVSADVCPGCSPPILRVVSILGGLLSTPENGAVEVWIAANDALTSGAWVKIEEDRSLVVSGGMAIATNASNSDLIEVLFSSLGNANNVLDQTAPAYAPRQIRPPRIRFVPFQSGSYNPPESGRKTLRVSAGYGDTTVIEMWGIDDTEALFSRDEFGLGNPLEEMIYTFSAEIGCEINYGQESTTVGVFVDQIPSSVTRSNEQFRFWRATTFTFEVPTAHLLGEADGNADSLRNGIRMTGASPLAGVVGFLSASTETDRSTVLTLPTARKDVNNRCAIPNGPWWHEQSYVPGGPLATRGQLHKITAKFSGNLSYSHLPFGVVSVGLALEPGFQANAGALNRIMRFFPDREIEFLPVFQGRRLLPRNYICDVIEGDTFTGTEVNLSGSIGPGDWDIQAIVHGWCQTHFGDVNGGPGTSVPTNITFTFLPYFIWNVRATTQWTGHRRWVRHCPMQSYTVSLGPIARTTLSAGGSVSAPVVENQGGFSTFLNCSVELSVSNFDP
jgi:hypothetical protein